MGGRCYRSYKDHQSGWECSGQMCDLRPHGWHPHYHSSIQGPRTISHGGEFKSGLRLSEDSSVGRLYHSRLLCEPGWCLFIVRRWPVTSFLSLSNSITQEPLYCRSKQHPLSCNSHREQVKIEPGSWLSKFTWGHHICRLALGNPPSVNLVGCQQYLWRNGSLYKLH